MDRLVAAVNAGDLAAFLAFFGTEGIVEDWGRFKGPAAIKKWSDEELIGANGRLTVTSASGKGNQVTVIGDRKSDYYSGASRMIFSVDGDHGLAMRIPQA